jgi:hypothetical protein
MKGIFKTRLTKYYYWKREKRSSKIVIVRTLSFWFKKRSVKITKRAVEKHIKSLARIMILCILYGYDTRA